jgi:hypothetical protein
MGNLTFLHNLTVGIKNAKLMGFWAPVNADKETTSNFVQWTILLKWIGLPQPTSPLYWRSRRKLPTGLSAAAEPRGCCSAPGTDNVLGKGMALLPDRPTQPGLPRLAATLKGTGERRQALPCLRWNEFYMRLSRTTPDENEDQWA